jgi:argininosuccinate lyase
MIHYPVRATISAKPVRAEKKPDARFATIVDSDDRVIAGGLTYDDAHEIVGALNARAAPRSRAKKQKIEDQYRASDLTAQIVDRQDIEYGHHESVPRGEHVARISTRKVRE